jgi:hypothetical protein
MSSAQARAKYEKRQQVCDPVHEIHDQEICRNISVHLATNSVLMRRLQNAAIKTNMKNTRNKMSSPQGSETNTADLTAQQDGDDEFSSEQAQDYALRHIGRLRRKAVRASVQNCGCTILARIVEELYCASRPAFDQTDALTDNAKAAAVDSIRALLAYGELDELLDSWMTPDVFYQICEDWNETFSRTKELRKAGQNGRERKPALVTVRFAVTADPAPVTAVINIDELTPAQRRRLADRVVNQDVCQLYHGGDGTFKLWGANREPERVIAEALTPEALFAAIAAEEAVLQERRQQHRHCAIAVARRNEPA